MMKQVLRGTALFSLITPAAMALELTNPHFEEARRSWQESPLRTADPVLNYSFNSKIAAGSSVGYTGQIFRQLLMVDLKTAMTSTDRDGAGIRGQYPGVEEEVVAVFDSYYSYRYDREITSTGMINGFVPFHFLPKDVNGWLAPVLEGTIYDEIQEEGKQLRNKTAGNDNALRRGSLKGWNTMEFHGQNLRTQESDSAGDGFVEPEDLIDAFFRIAADNAVHGLPFTVANGDRAPQMVDKAYVTEDGLDVAQLTQKLLYGAVSFSQAAIDYLGTGREGKGILASDSEPYKPGKPYTALEHHWDEAYGYYGAARDLPSYTREQLSAGVSIDSNGDQLISIQSEVNFVMPRNGAKLDRAAAEPDSRLSYAAWEYLTTGRRLIAEARPGYRDNLADVATLALGEWEKSLAARTIHYLNSVIKQMDAYGTDGYLFTTHAKYWGEMKGFGLAMQFSPVAILSDAAFDKVHRLMGDRPIPGTAGADAVAGYRQDLIAARNILRDAYGFSEASASAW